VELENKALETENKAIELEKRLTETENKIIELFTLYNGLLNSKSWKITYPLRLLGRFARWFKTGTIAWITFSPESRPRRVAKKTIIKIKDSLNKNPKLKSLVKFCLKPFPGLQDRLKEAGEDNKTISHDDNSTQIENSNLSPTARKIYNDLKKAIEERKKYENLD
jgi:O-antigen chain-terminating methyltransferase